MQYKYGDVVVYDGLTYVVVGTDDEYNTVDLLNQVSCTTEVPVDKVKPIGHEDNFRDNVKSLLVKHAKQFKQTVIENQKALVSLLSGKIFSMGDTSCQITGQVKVDGDYLYCQVKQDNFYDWIILEALLGELFANKYLTDKGNML